jgi:hypothetical protein
MVRLIQIFLTPSVALIVPALAVAMAFWILQSNVMMVITLQVMAVIDSAE